MEVITAFQSPVDAYIDRKRSFAKRWSHRCTSGRGVIIALVLGDSRVVGLENKIRIEFELDKESCRAQCLRDDVATTSGGEIQERAGMSGDSISAHQSGLAINSRQYCRKNYT